MSGLDLFERETQDRLERAPLLQNPDAGAWDGFARGAGMTAMRGFASVARAASLAGAVDPITRDLITGGTEAQDRYFKGHEELYQRAVDHWTPTPGEVGFAGQAVGTLLSLVPLVIASPAAAVATTQLSMAQDLVNQGVDPAKAQAVGAAYGAGIGLGIWVPILGQTLPQRMLLGGAGFNVAQGVGMRASASAILGEHPAAEGFRILSPEDLALDAILGLAFGGIAHLSPAARAQGAEFWARVEAWRRNLTPEQIEALAAVRHAQHAAADSFPGKPTTPESVEAHVARVKAAVGQLATDQPVNVVDLPPVRSAPDPARTAEAQARVAELQPIAEAVRQEEGLASPPEVSRGTRLENLTGLPPEEQPAAIGRAVHEALTRAGRPTQEAEMTGLIYEEFFRSQSDLHAIPAARILETYGLDVRQLGDLEDLEGALAQSADLRRRVDQALADMEKARAEAQQARADLAALRQARDELTDLQAKGANETEIAAATERWKQAREKVGARETEVKKLRTELDKARTIEGNSFQQARRKRVAPIGVAAPPRTGTMRYHGPRAKHPGVDWQAADLQDTAQRGFVTPESILKDYGSKDTPAVAYRAWLDINELPRERLVEEEDGDPGGYDWTEMAGLRGTYPPAKVRVTKDGKLEILDGNHRIRHWTENGAEYIPAWVVDERPGATAVRPDEDTFYQSLMPRFYSELQRQLEAVKQESATAEQWKGMILTPARKGKKAIRGPDNRPTGEVQEYDIPAQSPLKGVKPEEIEWSGVMEWLDLRARQAALAGDIEEARKGDAKITKQEVLDFLNGNLFQVEEILRGAPVGTAARPQRTPQSPEFAAEREILERHGWSIEQNPEDPERTAFVDPDGDFHDASDMRRYYEADDLPGVRNRLEGDLLVQAAERFEARWDAMREPVDAEFQRAPTDAVVRDDVEWLEGAGFELGTPENGNWAFKDMNGQVYRTMADIEDLEVPGGPTVRERLHRVMQYLVTGDHPLTDLETLNDRFSNLGWDWSVDGGEYLFFHREFPATRYALGELDTAPDLPPAVKQLAHLIVDANEAELAGAQNAREMRHAVQTLPASFDRPELKLPGGQEYRELQIVLKRPEQMLPPGYRVEKMASDDRALNALKEEWHDFQRSHGWTGPADPLDVPSTQWGRLGASRRQDLSRLQERWDEAQQAARTDRWTLVGPDGVGTVMPASRTRIQAETHAIAELQRKGVLKPSERFTEGHWTEPDTLLHLRFTVRTDADGKRVLFIEELQSDWAQKGRARGFKGNEPEPPSIEEMLKQTGMTIEETGRRREPWGLTHKDGRPSYHPTRQDAERVVRHAWQAQSREGKTFDIPTGPFVENTEAWAGLGMKRMLAWALENGFDRIAWTTGAQQTARYTNALRKHVDSIEWEKTPKGVHLVGYKGKGQTSILREHEANVRRLKERLDTLSAEAADEAGGYRALLGGAPRIIVKSPETRVALERAIGDADAIPDGGAALVYPLGNAWIMRLPDGSYEVDYGGRGESFAPEWLERAERGLWDNWARLEAADLIENPSAKLREMLTVQRALTEARIELRRQQRTNQGNREKVVDTTEKETALSDSIGKAMADQILGNPAQKGVIEGENIRVDKTGMAEFYDRILPAIMNKLLGKMGGGKVATTKIHTEIEQAAELPGGKGASEQMSFDVTPELVASAKKGLPLFQPGRGQIQFGDGETVIGLFESADASTFVHETGHFFLRVMKDLAERPTAPKAALQDWASTAKWLKHEGGELTREQHEQFARGWERYVAEGKAPNARLKKVFEAFKQWLLAIYHSLTDLNVNLSDEVRGVFDRMLAGHPKAEGPAGQTGTARTPPPRVTPAQPAGSAAPRERQPSQLLREVRELGGINQSHFADVTGEKRFGKVKGLPWGVFRPQGKDAIGQIREGHGLDEMASLLRQRGWDLPEGDEVNALTQLLDQEIRGERAVRLGEEDEVMTAARIAQEMDELHAQFTEAEELAAEKFNFNDKDPRYLAELERIRGERDAAMQEALNTATEPSQAEAARIARERPNLRITTGEDADGNPITQSPREYLEEASRAARQAEDDAELFQIAAACMERAA